MRLPAVPEAYSSPPQLLRFLLGAWSVSKTMQYTRGGKDGIFTGSATFAPLLGDASVLSFVEDGVATLGSDEQYSARQRLLYASDDSATLRVLFDESVARTSAADVMAGARFFHAIALAAPAPPPPFEHPCGPDMYRGRLVLEDEDTFRLLWTVIGPRKLGSVRSTFRRAESS